MGLRTKALLTAVLLTFYSSWAFALGLGEIKLNSALNQPLNAEIELLHVRDLTEREIIIGLASLEDFERAGVDRTFFLADLKFKLDINSATGPIVKVTTQEPVKEPFLNFILSAQWPSGRLLREYTLLIDLPIYTEAKPAPVQATQRREAPVSRQTTPRREISRQQVSEPRVNTPRVNPQPSRPSYSGDEYGPVGANENLWSIARKVRPGSDVTVQQTMLAIQRLNPEAFINNNINLLRKGQVLRVPDRNEIQTLTSRDAVQQVAAQNRDWSNRGKSKTDSPAQLEGSKSLTTTKKESNQVEGRIKLSSMKERNSSDGIGSGDGEDGTSAIESELSAAQEQLDATTRESSDLKSRIQAMEEQIQTMEKLVEISSGEMRAIELAAKQAAQTAEESTPKPEETAPAVDELATEEPVVEEPETTVAQETPVEETKEPEAKPQPVNPQPAAKKASWLDLVQENILYVAGGLGALVILIVGFLFMRNRDDGFDDDFDEELDQLRDDFEAPVDSELLPDADSEALLDEPLPEEIHEEVIEEEVEQAEAETEDVVSECDIHIAYGQYDQAEEKLVRALEQDERNIEARLKLLEVFAAQDDVEGFDSHFAKIHALQDQEAIGRASMLRGSLSGAGEFDPERYDTSSMNEVEEDIESTDTQIAATYSEETVGEDEYTEDDTLQFDFDESAEVPVETENTAEEAPAEITLEIGDDEEFESLEKEFNELDEELKDVEFDIPAEDISLELEDGSEFDDISVSNDASDNDLDVSLDDISSEFADLDVDLDNNELGDVSDPAADLELDAELDEPLLEESGTLSDNALDSDLGADDFAVADDLDLDDLDSEEVSSESIDALDFDLEKDLEEAIATDPNEGDAQGDLGDLDFGDIGEIELGSDSAGASGELDDLDLDGEDGAPAADFDSDSDFDVDFDIGSGDIALEDLDKELDDFELEESNDLESATAESSVAESVTPEVMEEPMTDLDELDLGPDLELDADEQLESEPELMSAVEEVQVDQPTTSDNLDFEIPDFDPENDDDSNLEFLSENDETATKLDLARAYIDMGDSDGAKDILDEIVEEGNDTQKKEAETLLSKLAS